MLTQVMVPWWVLPIIMVVLAMVMWVIYPHMIGKPQDPDDWWESHVSLEEAERMADNYRALANRLRKTRDMEVARELADKLLAQEEGGP